MNDLPLERLPSSVSCLTREQTDDQIAQLVADALERVNDGDQSAYFQLGQLYFEQEDYEHARHYLEQISEKDYHAKYQLAIMYYDGLGGEEDMKRGVSLLREIAEAPHSQVDRQVAHAAEYNLGRSCYHGYGLRRDVQQALRWWLLAADDGSDVGSVMAQTTLGYYYSQTDTRDLKRAYYWHTHACGNGSVESQGCLGIMYLHGLGVKADIDKAFFIFKDAAERGNVYAMGNLVYLYYRKKLFTKTTEIATKVLAMDDVDLIAKESSCLKEFISKGLAIASFIYGRCLHKALGTKQDEDEAHRHYSLCFRYDPDICAQMQDLANRGLV